mgnify:CR=1 FL=1
MSAQHRAGAVRPSDFQRIAHRGASAECPENTLVAFRRAMELGATMIECDLQLTADGHVVVFHDWSLERTTDGSGVASAPFTANGVAGAYNVVASSPGARDRSCCRLLAMRCASSFVRIVAAVGLPAPSFLSRPARIASQPASASALT